MMGESGQVAYEAYCNAVNWHDITGRPLPSWGMLTPEEQDIWRHVAHEVFQKCWVA
jgi:hypothetical protein